MAAYAVAQLRDISFGPAIVEYLERIDDTLAPFNGRFLVHGARAQVLEGDWRGDLVVIEFPSLEHARNWYRSPGYQSILKLRTENAVGEALLIEGVPPGYRATAVIARRAGKGRAQAAGTGRALKRPAPAMRPRLRAERVETGPRLTAFRARDENA